MMDVAVSVIWGVMIKIRIKIARPMIATLMSRQTGRFSLLVQ